MKCKRLTTELTSLVAVLSIAVPFFPASSFWLGSGWAEGVRARQSLENHYLQIIKQHTDLEALAQLAAYAARLSEGDGARFMWLMNGLILDTPPTWAANRLAILTGLWSRARERLHTYWSWFPGSTAALRFGDTGFEAADGGNQVQHLWYSTAFAYCWGASLADRAARYHEWNGPGPLRYLPGTGGGEGTAADLILSHHGIELGRALAEKKLRPQEVADWLRERLGPDHSAR